MIFTFAEETHFLNTMRAIPHIQANSSFTFLRDTMGSGCLYFPGNLPCFCARSAPASHFGQAVLGGRTRGWHLSRPAQTVTMIDLGMDRTMGILELVGQ